MVLFNCQGLTNLDPLNKSSSDPCYRLSNLDPLKTITDPCRSPIGSFSIWNLDP